MVQIKLNESVIVSDPCYSDKGWYNTQINDMLQGNYNVIVDKGDFDNGWGERVLSLTILHESIEDDVNYLDWEDFTDVCVDSGQCGIFSIDTYRNDTLVESIKTPPTDFVLPYNDTEGDKWYESMCKFTLSKDQWGLYDNGVVSGTGIGDGQYPVEIVKENEKVVGIRITYQDHSLDFLDDDSDVCGECGGELEDGECPNCNEEN